MKSEDIDFLTDLVRVHAGLSIRGDRAYVLETRLGAVARREGLESVPELIARLRASAADARVVLAAVEALAPCDTGFFRDRDVFVRLRDEVFPTLAQRRLGGVVRVWCAGCATGQEVYSLAMMMAPGAEGRPLGVELQLSASDLSERALHKARSGLYSHFEVQRGLPIRMLLDHFQKADDLWRISAALRQQVRWARINLVDDLSRVGPFDVVLCRNVLSAFDPAAAARVLERLDGCLAPDGWLVTGATETLTLPAAYQGSGGVYARNPAFGREAA